MISLRASLRELVFMLALALFVWFLVSSTAIQLEINLEIAFFGLKIGIMAIVIPFIADSMLRFYTDSELDKTEGKEDSLSMEYFHMVVEYHRFTQKSLLLASIFLTISILADFVYWLVRCSGVWIAGFSTLISSVFAIVVLMLHLSVRGLGEIETIREATFKTLDGLDNGDTHDAPEESEK